MGTDTSGANIADLVRSAAQQRPDHPALVTDGGSTAVTWSELDRSVDQFAAALDTAGIAHGARVALVLRTSPEFVVAYFGTVRSGRVAVPLNPSYTAPELSRMLGDAGVSLVVCDEDVAPTVADAAPDVRRVVRGQHESTDQATSLQEFASSGEGRPPPGYSEGGEDIALLLYTSGTSGWPKGAMLSHRALLANVEQVASAAVKSVEADDRVLMVLPMFHIYALNGTLTAIARAAATAVLAERFDPELTLGLVRSAGVTNIVGAPQMYAAWADRPGLRDALSGVRLLFTGAAPMPQALLEKIGEQTDLPVHEGYGLTEAAPGVASTLVTGRPKPGTVGRPFAGVEVRLVDDGDDNDRDGEGDEVGEGDPGEIWIKGDNLFSGYWPDGSSGPDESGWYATGDVAYKDSDGDLVLVDRQKELIIVNGFNVYPREVEEAIKALDDVVEAAVVGIADPRSGEAVKAYVETREGSSLTPDDVVSFIANRLARFKWPSAVEFVETLPHTATGKVAKGKLQGSVPAGDDT